jgi:acetyl-CoA synthetase
MSEQSLFPPLPEFAKNATIDSLAAYEALYAKAAANPELFWAELAQQELHWFKPWDTVLDWSNPPFAKWFNGGKINISYNCLDRHLTTDRKDKPALIWEGEPGDSQTLSYLELHQEVCQMANTLLKLGVTKGDRVAVYMPMIPEAAIAMLACARIGAVHTVVFSAFSAESLRNRIVDGGAKLVITADGGWRKDAIMALKPKVDEAIANNACPTVQKVLVVQRTQNEIAMVPDRDHWWHIEKATASTDCPAAELDAEDLLFILYTSGSTGKPKGVVHTVGGYNLYTHMTTKWIFDIKDRDVYWCTADVGWITGHSYIVYGPLSNGATTLIYEGAPRPSNPGCFWDVIQKHKVTIFYTAPTAIRTFMGMSEELPNARDLSSLRLLGSVGEPINPKAWLWYHRVIGKERCPIIDTWWQTETGGIMITALPGAIATKPGSATRPFPGIMTEVVDLEGKPLPHNEDGYLVIRHPWPGMMRTVYGDSERFRANYWEYIKPIDGKYFYFTGDAARQDEDGYFWIIGRVDDVINVSGHRLGSGELESALVSHPATAEAAVVGIPDEITGEKIVAFVILRQTATANYGLIKELKQLVRSQIGPFAGPSLIYFTDALPKTRSGKIMRRFLRRIAEGEEITGDTSTLEDPSVLDRIRKIVEAGELKPDDHKDS